jgi:hypothetical protein
MSPKLPVVSGEDIIRVLRKFGYEIVRQKGVMSACGMSRNRNAFQLQSRFIKK